MSFNNPNNRCTFNGYICSEFIVNQSGTSLEFKIGVERKTDVVGAKKFTDFFNVYVCKAQVISLIKTLAQKGSVIKVKGELRNWNDNTVKLCADSVIVKA